MVLFFQSTTVSPPAMVYVGKDKVENEDLIRYGLKQDVWFHVDKLSSAHVYLRMNEGMTWDNIPEKLLVDLGQLTKANSIEGNKKNNITIIYTPHSNLKKTGDMQTGAVSFHSDKLVKRVYIPARDNAIVNRLVKTKVVKEVDHEADRIERLRNEGKSKKAIANELKNSQLETQRMYAKAKADQSYDAMFAELNEAGPASDRRHLDDEGEDEDLEGGDRGGDDDDFW